MRPTDPIPLPVAAPRRHRSRPSLTALAVLVLLVLGALPFPAPAAAGTGLASLSLEPVVRAALALHVEPLEAGVLPAGPRVAALPGVVRAVAHPSFDPDDPPFRVRHFPLKDLPLKQLFPEPRGKTPLAYAGPTDRDGVPMSRKGNKLFYSPTGIAIEALRRLWVYIDTEDQRYLDVAIAWATKLRTLMTADLDGTLWLPFTWNDPDQKLTAPWYNALGQGSALALFVRLGRITGDAHWMDTADGLFGGFVKLGPSRKRPWVAQAAGGNLWLEHYPNGVRGHVLNAHLYAAFGLRDYWQAVRHDPARASLVPLARLMTEAAFTTIREKGERFRRPGTWSWYNLVRPVANRQYHIFHIRELKAAAVATGDPWFSALARRFVADYQP